MDVQAQEEASSSPNVNRRIIRYIFFTLELVIIFALTLVKFSQGNKVNNYWRDGRAV